MTFVFILSILSGACAVLLILGLKYLLPQAAQDFRYRKRIRHLQHFIAGNLYDLKVLRTAVRLNSPVQYQDADPYVLKNTGKDPVRRKNLFRLLDLFLTREVPCRYLLILGASGMGKSSALIRYFAEQKEQPQQGKLVLLPMSMQDLDAAIDEVPDKNNTALMLDGLDEDVEAFSDPHKRLRQIMDQTRRFRRVIITCQQNFIPRIAYLPIQKGYEIVEPAKPGEKRLYRLVRCYLSPLTKAQAGTIIDYCLSPWKRSLKKNIMGALELKGFVFQSTPLIIGFLARALPETIGVLSIGNVYKTYVADQIRGEGSWQDKKRALLFLQYLAKKMFLNWLASGQDYLQAEKMIEKLKAFKLPDTFWETREQELIRFYPDGTIKFSHRTLMEFLFARQLVAGDTSCYNVPLSSVMKTFIFERLNASRSVKLKQELAWLSGFGLKACGIKIKPLNSAQAKSPDIFFEVLKSNSGHGYLRRLGKLLENPIFYEFGWDRELFENLEKAIYQSKSTLMKLKKKNWVVLVNPKKIEITKRDRKTMQILINEKDSKTYISLKDQPALQKLNRSIGLSGLKMMASINRSKKTAVLPDLATFKTFTLFFKADLLKNS